MASATSTSRIGPPGTGSSSSVSTPFPQNSRTAARYPACLMSSFSSGPEGRAVRGRAPRTGARPPAGIPQRRSPETAGAARPAPAGPSASPGGWPPDQAALFQLGREALRVGQALASAACSTSPRLRGAMSRTVTPPSAGHRRRSTSSSSLFCITPGRVASRSRPGSACSSSPWSSRSARPSLRRSRRGARARRPRAPGRGSWHVPTGRRRDRASQPPCSGPPGTRRQGSVPGAPAPGPCSSRCRWQPRARSPARRAARLAARRRSPGWGETTMALAGPSRARPRRRRLHDRAGRSGAPSRPPPADGTLTGPTVGHQPVAVAGFRRQPKPASAADDTSGAVTQARTATGSSASPTCPARPTQHRRRRQRTSASDRPTVLSSSRAMRHSTLAAGPAQCPDRTRSRRTAAWDHDVRAGVQHELAGADPADEDAPAGQEPRTCSLSGGRNRRPR
jgi:hypothetical protein